MNKLTVIAAAGAIMMASCVGNPEGKKADTAEAAEVGEVVGATYTADTEESELVWNGKKVSGEHFGTVDLKSGHIVVAENEVVGGEFVFDLNTINTTDLEGEWKDKLDGHLKSDDFFDVANHPEATLVVTEVKAGDTDGELVVAANLTIRGTTKNITFDAQVEELTETSVKVTADFNIVREDWGINYTGAQDDLISKEINFKVNIVANNG